MTGDVGFCAGSDCWHESGDMLLAPEASYHESYPIAPYIDHKNIPALHRDFPESALQISKLSDGDSSAFCPLKHSAGNRAGIFSEPNLYKIMGATLGAVAAASAHSADSISSLGQFNPPTAVIAVVAFTAFSGAVQYFYHHITEQHCVGSLIPIQHYTPEVVLNITDLNVTIPLERLDFDNTTSEIELIVVDDNASLTPENTYDLEKQQGNNEKYSIDWMKAIKYTTAISALAAGVYLLPATSIVSPILCLLLKSASMSALGDLLSYICPELGDITSTVSAKYFSYATGGMIAAQLVPLLFSPETSLLKSLFFAISARTTGGIASSLFFSSYDGDNFSLTDSIKPSQIAKDACKSTLKTILNEVLAPVAKLGSVLNYSTRFFSSVLTNVTIDMGKSSLNDTIDLASTQHSAQHRSLNAIAKVAANVVTDTLHIAKDTAKFFEYIAKASAPILVGWCWASSS